MTLPPLPERTKRFGGDEAEDFIALLETQHRQKMDVVAPLSMAKYTGGMFDLETAEPLINEYGVTEVSGLYRPTRTADTQLGGLFGIPSRYMDKMRAEHLGLLDVNVNEWAQRSNRNVLYRFMYGEDERYPGTSGILRAVKSDRYGVRDNFDTALATMDGMSEAGLDATNFTGADITDDRMWLKISAPGIYINAPELLRGYRDPRTGTSSREVGDVVYAGLIVSNSETGLGSLKITPVLEVLACRNGMVMNKLAMAKVHLGAKMDEGAIQWSQATCDAANTLTKLQVKDAITAFLSTDFLQRAVNDLTEQASKPVEDAVKTLEFVGKKMSYSEDEQAGILNRFIKGGQATAGGVMQAVTNYAQDVADIERANQLQATGVEAMELAAGL